VTLILTQFGCQTKHKNQIESIL